MFFSDIELEMIVMTSEQVSRSSLTTWTIAWAIVIALAWTFSAQEIPPASEHFSFTDDYASLFEPRTVNELGKLQKATFEAHKTPIIVITVRSIAEYEWSGPIEGFTAAWFNAWGIGTPERNTGILLLISLGDRKARIVEIVVSETEHMRLFGARNSDVADFRKLKASVSTAWAEYA